MIDLFSTALPWVKALHVISVISWMAGLFYLPRLFVYHAEQVQTGQVQAQDLFATMERRLLKAIMNPAMIATWIFGLIMVATPGVIDWSDAWPWTKGGAVLAMTWFHMWLARRRKAFEAGRNSLTGRTYRLMNEVPTLLMVIIVFSVIVRF